MGRPVGHPDNSLIGTARNHEWWAGVDDRSAATKPARDAFRNQFIEKAREKFGDDLAPEDLARRAESLRKAHYARLALKSAQARRARKAAGAGT